MRRRKADLPNPVLHFGSDVARDIIKKEVNDHFARAFKKKTEWKQELNLGMLKAMKDNRQPKEVKSWLQDNCKEHEGDVAGLMRRYVLILDTTWRKADFLAGKVDFWEASKKMHSPKPAISYYKELVHRVAICCEKRNIPTKEFADAVDEERNQIKRQDGT